MPAFQLLLRILLVAVIHFMGFSVGGTVFPPPLPEGAVIDPMQSALALLAVCLGNAVLLALVIRSSRLWGWRLVGAVALLFWGSATFMSQMEVAFFGPDLVPDGAVAMIVGMGTLNAVITLPAAVWLLSPSGAQPAAPDRPDHLLPKFAVNAVLYVVIYLTFGYFVAMRSPALLEYYGLRHPGSFLGQLTNIATENPLLFPFQFVRGFLWTALIYPASVFLKGPWWQRGLVIGLGLAGFMSFPLLLPNPLMPWAIGSAHFVETFPSNALYGLLATGVLLAPARPAT
jgi:hypothetical protein